MSRARAVTVRIDACSRTPLRHARLGAASVETVGSHSRGHSIVANCAASAAAASDSAGPLDRIVVTGAGASLS